MHDIASSRKTSARFPTDSPRSKYPISHSPSNENPLAEVGERESAGEAARIRKHTIVSYGDGVTWGVMVGLGETYLPAFALAMGLGEVTSGLVASIPMAIGGWLQLASPWGLRKLGSHRGWVILCVLLQAISFIPLVLAAMYGSASAMLVFAAATGYWVSGQASNPAWNLWIGQIIPREIRSQFFASRTRWAQLATCLGFVLGGFSLQLAKDQGWLPLAFAGIFACSAVVRLVSGYMLYLHDEATPKPFPTDNSSTHWSASPNTKLLIYLSVVQAFAQFSGPYFTPYILKRLEYSYLQYVALIGSSYVAKAVSLPYWGRYAHRHGAWQLLRLGGLCIIPLAAIWIPTTNFWVLTANQIAAGIFWGAYELAFFLLFFESIPEAKRTQWLTWYNVVNSTAWAIGAVSGGIILRNLGATSGAYFVLFAGSSMGRALAGWFLLPRHSAGALQTETAATSHMAEAATTSPPAAAEGVGPALGLASKGASAETITA